VKKNHIQVDHHDNAHTPKQFLLFVMSVNFGASRQDPELPVISVLPAGLAMMISHTLKSAQGMRCQIFCANSGANLSQQKLYASVFQSFLSKTKHSEDRRGVPWTWLL